MATNVEVTKNTNENNLGLIRRFTKRVQGSGVLPRLRGRRYSKRALSPYVRKKKTLARIEEQTALAELVKMGKAPEKKR